MAEQYSKITLNQLDIEALSDYVVESRNLVYRNNEVDSSSTKAMDVDNVAGIESTLIAKAVSKEDRETVKNALNLGGFPAEDYMKVTSGTSIATNQLKMKKVFGGEIRDLQDEFNQLRNELIKSGAIENKGQYNGYIDTFKRNKYINIQDLLGVADTLNTAGNNQIHIEDLDLYNSLDKYDFICIYNKENNTFDIKEIAEKNDEAKVITLDSDLRAVVKNSEMELYKSKGIIHNGEYKFANAAENQLGSEEYHTGLSDDTYNVIKRINETYKGFGYSFRIPEAKQGFVTSIEICAKATGNPGSLVCYIIDERDLDKFINPSQASDDYKESQDSEATDGFKFFAKSQPYTLNSSLGKRYIKFNFQQNDGTYPLMTRDSAEEQVRYIMVVEAQQADSSNYIDLVFLQHKSSTGELTDLELNNTTYYYKRQPDASQTPALTTDEEINKTDMYYHIVTRSVTENEPEAQRQGLYSTHISYMNSKKDLDAAKARVMLRIRREGMYQANVDSLEPKVYIGEALSCSNEDKFNDIKTIDDLRLKTDIYKRIQTRSNEKEISEQIYSIIGNNIVKVQGTNDTTITLQTPALIKNKDKVYRCGYLVNLKARRVSFNANGLLETTAYDNYILPLSEVYKDYDPSSREYSDRLIFEADLFGKDQVLKNYNDFELQIYWENRELSNYTDIKKAQMGSIFDLVLTFTQSY